MYKSLDNGTMMEEFVCTHDEFHGQKREEAVIISMSDIPQFAKIIKMFDIVIRGSVHHIALAQEYCLTSPLEYVGNDKGMGFPLLQLEPPQHAFFVPVVKFIR